MKYYREKIRLPAPTQNGNAHGHSRLLALPAELRCMIYEEVSNSETAAEALPLLQTCRQIYHEAHPTLFPKVVHEVPGDPWILFQGQSIKATRGRRRALESLDIQARRSIATIRVKCLPATSVYPVLRGLAGIQIKPATVIVDLRPISDSNLSRYLHLSLGGIYDTLHREKTLDYVRMIRYLSKEQQRDAVFGLILDSTQNLLAAQWRPDGPVPRIQKVRPYGFGVSFQDIEAVQVEVIEEPRRAVMQMPIPRLSFWGRVIRFLWG